MLQKTASQTEFLTVQETARYLRLSRNTVWRWCVEGKLTAFKLGRNWRIRRDVVETLTQG